MRHAESLGSAPALRGFLERLSRGAAVWQRVGRLIARKVRLAEPFSEVEVILYPEVNQTDLACLESHQDAFRCQRR